MAKKKVETKRKGAPKGNAFWKLRTDMSKDGRKLSTEDFAVKVQEYIDRCLTETTNEIDFRGRDLKMVILPHMKPILVTGLCFHCGISKVTLSEWEKDEKYSYIIEQFHHIRTTYNVEGASANLLHPNIIARVEELSDKAKVDHSSTDGTMSLKGMSIEEMKERIKASKELE